MIKVIENLMLIVFHCITSKSSRDSQVDSHPWVCCPQSQKLSVSMVFLMKKNVQWTYQQLLIEFIQTTHQTALRVLAQVLFDEQFS